MDLEEMQHELQSHTYDFLRQDEHLGKNVFLLVPGGSHAYGTDVESSDFDLRGGTLETVEDILAATSFEQFEELKETDTVIYGFRKLISLLKNCNPNVIEILGTKDVLYANELGRELLEHRHMFLSQKAYVTFSGYATAQLRRLENAIAHDTDNEAQRQLHIKGTLEIQLMQYREMFARYAADNVVDLSLNDKSEIIIGMQLRNVPLNDYMRLVADMRTTIRNYAKLTGRSNKRDEAHLYKHAMHLIRLYLMGIDILRDEEIVTYRGKERGLLLDIRNGKLTMQQIFDLRSELEEEMLAAKAETRLPYRTDNQAIDAFVVHCYKKYLFKQTE